MSSMAARLELYEAVLALIQKKRLENRDQALGADLEQVIVDNQFRDIEAEIFENPGAFEPWLVRRRPN